jgi:hypothetical protein
MKSPLQQEVSEITADILKVADRLGKLSNDETLRTEARWAFRTAASDLVEFAALLLQSVGAPEHIVARVRGLDK